MISAEAKHYSNKIAEDLFTLRARKKGRGWAKRTVAKVTQGELAELLGQAYDAGRTNGQAEAEGGDPAIVGCARELMTANQHLRCPDPKSCAAKGKCTEPHLQHHRTPKLAGMTLDSGDPR